MENKLQDQKSLFKQSNTLKRKISRIKPLVAGLQSSRDLNQPSKARDNNGDIWKIVQWVDPIIVVVIIILSGIIIVIVIIVIIGCHLHFLRQLIEILNFAIKTLPHTDVVVPDIRLSSFCFLLLFCLLSIWYYCFLIIIIIIIKTLLLSAKVRITLTFSFKH